MKTQTSFSRFPILTLAAALVLAAGAVPAQNAANTSAGQPAPLLSYGVNQIIQLSQAKVGDDTIVNFIRNSGSSYGLDADQVVYLKQQGVSDTVINTMLNQPRLTETAPPAAPVNAVAPPAPACYVDPIYVNVLVGLCDSGHADVLVRRAHLSALLRRPFLSGLPFVLLRRPLFLWRQFQRQPLAWRQLPGRLASLRPGAQTGPGRDGVMEGWDGALASPAGFAS